MMAKKGQPAAKKGATAGKGENGNLAKLKQLAQKFFNPLDAVWTFLSSKKYFFGKIVKNT